MALGGLSPPPPPEHTLTHNPRHTHRPHTHTPTPTFTSLTHAYQYTALPPTSQLVPMWVAPNLLTFTGWCLLVVNFFILAFYDWDYYTTTNDLGIVRPPIPEWVWLFCAVSHFVAHTLDGIDGKQARRTGMSTPLG